jgi:D-hexose-6-phosphate mutarotase
LADIAALAARFAVRGRIAIEASPLGGPIARLMQGDQQALVALHGGQVLNWTSGGAGLLWLSPTARIREGKSIRGGIPVCWPWFGDHPQDATKPAHGFVRQRAWDVIDTEATAGSVRVTLATMTREADGALWPHQAEVRLTVTLGAGLSLALKTTNTGPAPLQLTQALHTYFRVSDIANAEVTGLDGCSYLDKLAGFARMTQSGAIRFGGEVDRIYVGDTGAVTLADHGMGRRLLIASTGSRSAVVWNPWVDKTARLGDMGSAEAYRQMLCIETANAGDDVVRLAPGAQHALGVRYAVAGRAA